MSPFFYASIIRQEGGRGHWRCSANLAVYRRLAARRDQGESQELGGLSQATGEGSSGTDWQQTLARKNKEQSLKRGSLGNLPHSLFPWQQNSSAVLPRRGILGRSPLIWKQVTGGEGRAGGRRGPAPGLPREPSSCVTCLPPSH